MEFEILDCLLDFHKPNILQLALVGENSQMKTKKEMWLIKEPQGYQEWTADDESSDIVLCAENSL